MKLEIELDEETAKRLEDFADGTLEEEAANLIRDVLEAVSPIKSEE